MYFVCLQTSDLLPKRTYVVAIDAVEPKCLFDPDQTKAVKFPFRIAANLCAELNGRVSAATGYIEQERTKYLVKIEFSPLRSFAPGVFDGSKPPVARQDCGPACGFLSESVGNARTGINGNTGIDQVPVLGSNPNGGIE